MGVCGVRLGRLFCQLQLLFEVSVPLPCHGQQFCSGTYIFLHYTREPLHLFPSPKQYSELIQFWGVLVSVEVS